MSWSAAPIDWTRSILPSMHLNRAKGHAVSFAITSALTRHVGFTANDQPSTWGRLLTPPWPRGRGAHMSFLELTWRATHSPVLAEQHLDNCREVPTQPPPKIPLPLWVAKP